MEEAIMVNGKTSRNMVKALKKKLMDHSILEIS